MVRKRSGVPKCRTIVRFDAINTVSRATVHNNDLPNVLRGLRERVFAVEGPNGLQPPPRPRRGVFQQRMRPYSSELVSLVGRCQPISMSAFVDHYSGAKKVRYQKAQLTVEAEGLPRGCGKLGAFVKSDFLNLDKKPDPAPRIIQPRAATYNVALGPFIYPLEARIYKALGRMFGGPTVMKGYNAAEIGELFEQGWSEFSQPVAVSMDASRFDQHVSVDALLEEHHVYRSIYANCTQAEKKLLAKLLNMQIFNKGAAYLPEAVVKYEVEGNRMSGDMNTALGNCLLMCLMVYAYAKECGVRVRLFDNGDDAVVIMEQRDLPAFMARVVEWFLEMGFTMNLEAPVTRMESIEFCQTRPVCVDGSYIMVRNPMVALSKDYLWKLPDREGNRVHADRWMSAVGACGLSLCSGVPIMQASYEYMVTHIPAKRGTTLGFGDGNSGLERLSEGLCRGPRAIAASTRVSFWLAFGITPDAQEAFESEFRHMKRQSGTRLVIEGDSLNQRHIPTYEFAQDEIAV